MVLALQLAIIPQVYLIVGDEIFVDIMSISLLPISENEIHVRYLNILHRIKSCEICSLLPLQFKKTILNNLANQTGTTLKQKNIAWRGWIETTKSNYHFLFQDSL